MKNSTSTRQLSKLQLLNFSAKFVTEKKYLMKTLTIFRMGIFGAAQGWEGAKKPLPP